MPLIAHQYIDRRTGTVKTERLAADRLVNLVYSELRENVPALFRALTSARASQWMSYLNFDNVLASRIRSPRDLMNAWNVSVDECLEPPETLDTPEKVFTRKIRYWESRPMSQDTQVVVSPVDARVLVLTGEPNPLLYLKNKFFDPAELLGENTQWSPVLKQGDCAIFRLTPDKYHYVHTPVDGRILDSYQVSGAYHSCNPGAVVELLNPLSKNRRFVTIIDTDQPGGTGVGRVAIIEIVAMMVGGLDPCYSSDEYNYPVPAKPGMFLNKGQPKSLFRPGSSTVVLMFEPGRIRFDEDLLRNQNAAGVSSRYSRGFGHPLVETELQVRSSVGRAVEPAHTRA